MPNKHFIHKTMRFPWYLYLFTYYLKCRFLHKKIPLLAGFKITNRCNLNCLHCPFWKRDTSEMLTFNQVKNILSTLHQLGIRILILEGGEPLLWKDGKYTIHDVVEVAKSLFYSVGITTNGTLPLTTKTHTIWVSIDGIKETHNQIRGNCFDKIIANIKNSPHPNIFANITINRLNCQEIPELVRFLTGKIKGITIQFHYPYEKGDTLTLSFEKRREVLDNLISLKKEGYPLTDSYLCLECLKDNSWDCQDWMLANVEPDGSINLGCYVKERGKVRCKMCGFAAHAEISLAYKWHIESILTGKKIFQYGKLVHNTGVRGQENS